ncbi:MAG: UDP-N-acetylglucosamine--N-acetylmuramyl-(pentapeptide) pyrophosphoryl-undecaprenol N-acetylglucosamine transferase [Pirellulales bacterium]|nr:UDP-N-acetylglucosamine--N-acetylmuramyl-(pentapeptide) pyrophosphoryl-undecaprenol N-acetylglucosamine transferase [Pirellulales bacterium]
MSTAYAPHIIFAGGGTGGHLGSGLNVAGHVARQLPQASITFIGTGRPLERQTVREAGYQYVAISAQPAPHSPVEAIRYLTENIAGYWAARWLLRDQKATLVVGLGGLASGAVVRAGVARGIPTILLEQNAFPSRITRWIARDMSVVCTGFDPAHAKFPSGVNVQWIGNPIRSSLEALATQVRPRPAEPGNRPQRLIVLGGSLGAEKFNRAVPAALARLREQLRGWCIVHQSGPGRVEETRQRYLEAGLDALTVGILDDFAEVLVASDLVISRASGMILAELAVAGAPAVVLPYPDAANDVQMANARIFADGGACHVVDEEAAGGRLDSELAAQLGPLLSNPDSRSRMSAAMLQQARPSAAKEIARIVADMAHGRLMSAA